jgi:STAGA complex 65 subunit gamma
MHHNDRITELIDTYTSRDSNCLLDPNFSISSKKFKAQIRINKKFQKPIWFIPPIDTEFIRGKPKEVAKINKKSVTAALRKSVCGLIRTCKFAEVDESALVMLIDSVDHFYNQLIESFVAVLVSENRETETQLSVLDLEKGYQAFAGQSIISLHNFFNTEIVQKNQKEVENFMQTFGNYDKLLQRQQNLTAMYFNSDSPGLAIGQPKLEDSSFDGRFDIKNEPY